MASKNRWGLGEVFQRSYPVGKDENGQHIYKKTEVWSIRYSFGGKQYTESTGSRKRSDAVKLLNTRLAEIGRGEFTGVDPRKLTLSELLGLVETDYVNQRRRTTAELPATIRRLERYFGSGIPALSVTTAKANAFIQWCRDEEQLADSTINGALAVLKRGFNLAKRQGRLTTVPWIPTVRVDNVRKNFLEREDLEAISKHLPEPLRPVAQFAYLTGWRRNEILELEWARVDLERGTMWLDKSKNDEGRLFPFAALPELNELIRERRRETDRVEREQGRIVPCVFHRDGQPILDPYTGWRSACVNAGFGRYYRNANGGTNYEGPRLHDFRRTAVRNLVRAGIPELLAMKLSGHKTRSVFDRYNITTERDLVDSVEKLADYHLGQPKTRSKVAAIKATSR